MVTRRQFLAGLGALILTVETGCHNPTTAEISEGKAREDAKQLKGDSHPSLGSVLSYPKQEVCYKVYNYPNVGDETNFWDAGRTKREGDGSVDYVQIVHTNRDGSEFIGRKDPRFPEYEKMFEEQVRPAAEKAGMSFSR